MTLRAVELERVVADLAARLAGGWVQDTRQPVPERLWLSFRAPGHSWGLLLSCEPGLCRLHLTEARPANAPTPPQFLQRAESELEGAKLVAIGVEDGAVVFSFERGGVAMELVLCADGRQPHLWLAGPDGSHWALLGREGAVRAVRGADRFAAHEGAALHAAIEAQYEGLGHDQRAAKAEAEARKRLRDAFGKADRTCAKVRGDLDKARAATDLLRWGELLKPVARSIPRGTPSVEVPDYGDPALPLVLVPLDPALDGHENLRRYFAQGRRLQAAAAKIAQRLAGLEERRAALLALQLKLDAGPVDLEKLNSLLSATSSPRNQGGEPRSQGRRAEAERLPYREHRSSDGLTILVGRSARDNDALVTRIARPEDLWLHARGRRGAHVVVRVPSNRVVPPATLHEAVLLAAWHAEGGRNDSWVEVEVAERRHVSKSRKSAPGAVTVSRSKTVGVAPATPQSAALVARLLGHDPAFSP